MHISCLFSRTVQVDKSESWYATNPFVSYCETGGWTCSPCVFSSKTTEHQICWRLVYMQQHASSMQKFCIISPCWKTLAEAEPSSTHALQPHYTFFNIKYTILVTSDLLFCFKELSFYRPLSLKHDSNPHVSIKSQFLFMERPGPACFAFKRKTWNGSYSVKKRTSVAQIQFSLKLRFIFGFGISSSLRISSISWCQHNMSVTLCVLLGTGWVFLFFFQEYQAERKQKYGICVM